MSYLREKGIETAIHYPAALPNLPCYQYLAAASVKTNVATALQKEILSLPLYPELGETEIAYVADSIVTFYK
jgi:dTDP-4-amino-4,6-dideoxygalactose transaminase